MDNYINDLQSQIQKYAHIKEQRSRRSELEEKVELTIELPLHTPPLNLDQTRYSFKNIWIDGLRTNFYNNNISLAPDQLRWIHLPYNNAAWIPKLLLSLIGTDSNIFGKYMQDDNWSENNERTRRAPLLHSMKPCFRKYPNNGDEALLLYVSWYCVTSNKSS